MTLDVSSRIAEPRPNAATKSHPQVVKKNTDCILEIDGMGCVTHASAAALSLLGRDEGEIKGMYYGLLLRICHVCVSPSDIRNNLGDSVADSLGGVTSKALAMARCDGQLQFVEVFIDPVYDETDGISKTKLLIKLA